MGQALQLVLAALEAAGSADLGADVFGIARFPLDLADDEELVASVRRTGRVIAVEEHYVTGGMGESLRGSLPPVESFEVLAPSYDPSHRYGSSRFHHEQCGLTPRSVLAALAKERVGCAYV